MPLSFDDIMQAVRDSLTPDLLDPKWRHLVKPDDPHVKGHCAIATEAFYYLVGGKKAGFMPYVCSYYYGNKGQIIFDVHPDKNERRTHWWAAGPAGARRGKGHIFDLTVNQYRHDFPYEQGRGAGFMQPQKIPSKRAQIVMDRVTKRFGKAALKQFRGHNIKAYKQACKQKPPAPLP